MRRCRLLAPSLLHRATAPERGYRLGVHQHVLEISPGLLPIAPPHRLDGILHLTPHQVKQPSCCFAFLVYHLWGMVHLNR